jgi:uncharacterized small protein (DUF1192 family)
MSKYSSFKDHQLITENWRKFLNEGKEEQLARAGQEALEELGEDEIMARLAALPPEIQAKLDAAATDIAEKFASQLQEGDVSSDREWEGEDRSERTFQGKFANEFAKAGALLGTSGGLFAAAHWKMAAEGVLPFFGTLTGGFGLGLTAGLYVAGALLNARKKLRKDLRDTVVTEPVSGPDPES